MNILKTITALVAFMFFTGTAAVAQQPAPAPNQTEEELYSDSELENFANAYQQIQVIGKGMQSKLMEVVQEEGMNMERFNAIHVAKSTPGQEIEVTTEEDRLYKQALTKIEVMQTDFDGHITGVIIENNLTVEKYQQIIAALQSSQELQLRLQKIMTQ